MAARQYIGARYVPAFYENSDGTSEWRTGVAYEPLTIVTYNANSYTSKKYVPATIGDPSVNPGYWVQTANFNQQVADLTTEVNTIKSAVQWFTPQMFGGAGDGITNDTLAVQTAISRAEAVHGAVLIPPGTYLVDGVTISDFICIFCSGTLKASAICDDVVTINVPYFYQDGAFTTWHEAGTMHFRIDGSDTAETGINAVQANHCVIGYGSVIYAVTEYGVKMDHRNPECIIDSLYIEGSGDACTGILTGEDCEIRNVIMKDCHTAIESAYSCNISGVHAWVTRATTGSIFIKHVSGICTVTNCYSDTAQYAFYKEDDSGSLLVDTVRVYTNINFLPNADAYILYAGTQNAFAYGRITNLIARNIQFANRTDILLGYANWRLDNIAIPNDLNTISTFTIAGQTSGTNTVKLNRVTDTIAIDFNCRGSFSGNVDITGVVTSGTFGPVELTFLASISETASQYTPTNVAQIYLATNGNMVVKPIGISNFTAIAGHIEYRRHV